MAARLRGINIQFLFPLPGDQNTVTKIGRAARQEKSQIFTKKIASLPNGQVKLASHFCNLSSF